MNLKPLSSGLLALAVSTTMAFADAGHGNSAFGRAGEADQVDRTIMIDMDEMDFSPDTITVSEGETVRFVVRNVGKVIHEFNLGDRDSWKGHQKEMSKMFRMGMMNMRRINHDKMEEAGMMHDDPNSILLEPGETGEVIWTFGHDVDMGFACNVPGHLSAGMVGDVQFQ